MVRLYLPKLWLNHSVVMILQQTEEDMLSKLNDDLLVSILGNVNLTTAMRASVVSKRWKHLPWLLTQLRINIKDFIHEPYADPTVDGHIDKAMSSLTEAVKTMLAPTRKSIIKRLCISFFLTNRYSDEIGRLVSEAIENGVVKDLNMGWRVSLLILAMRKW